MTADAAPTQVFFTVDVEISMGGAWTRSDWEPLSIDHCVYCRRPGRPEAGLRLIMDLLEAHRLPGVFFVDTAMQALGDPVQFRDLCQEIDARGHDVELHLHPAAAAYATLRRQGPVAARPPGLTDMIADLPEERQIELLTQGRDILADAVGRPPVAFRSGNYSFSRALPGVLQRCGLAVDLSANLAYPGGDLFGRTHAPRRIGRLVELPVTQLLGRRLPGRGYRPLEVNAIAHGEMRRALLQLHAGGQRAAVIVFHSFGLTKGRGRRWENARIDPVVLARLRKLAEFLGHHRHRLPASRLDHCVAQTGWLDSVTAGPDVWPTTTWPLLAARYAGQLASRL